MIKGIRLKHGVIFVEWGGFSTYRYSRGAWDVSPVLYHVLEWDLQTESPDSWEYMTEGEIRGLDTFDELCAVHKKTCEIFGWKVEETEK